MDLNFEVKQVVTTEYMLFDASFREVLKMVGDEELEPVMEILKLQIEDNYKNEIYSNIVKENIYELLLIIKYRTNDERMKQEINILEDILLDTKNTNVGKFLYKNFYLLFNGLADNFLLHRLTEQNILKLENIINTSIVNDFPFIKSLLNDSEEEFIQKHCYNASYLTNLSFLISEYPSLLKQENLKNKIQSLLDEVLRISKMKKIECVFEGKTQMVEIPPQMKRKTKSCMKLIKGINKKISRGELHG